MNPLVLYYINDDEMCMPFGSPEAFSRYTNVPEEDVVSALCEQDELDYWVPISPPADSFLKGHSVRVGRPPAMDGFPREASHGYVDVFEFDGDGFELE